MTNATTKKSSTKKASELVGKGGKTSTATRKKSSIKAQAPVVTTVENAQYLDKGTSAIIKSKEVVDSLQKEVLKDLSRGNANMYDLAIHLVDIRDYLYCDRATSKFSEHEYGHKTFADYVQAIFGISKASAYTAVYVVDKWFDRETKSWKKLFAQIGAEYEMEGNPDVTVLPAFSILGLTQGMEDKDIPYSRLYDISANELRELKKSLKGESNKTLEDKGETNEQATDTEPTVEQEMQEDKEHKMSRDYKGYIDEIAAKIEERYNHTEGYTVADAAREVLKEYLNW